MDREKGIQRDFAPSKATEHTWEKAGVAAPKMGLSLCLSAGLALHLSLVPPSPAASGQVGAAFPPRAT